MKSIAIPIAIAIALFACFVYSKPLEEEPYKPLQSRSAIQSPECDAKLNSLNFTMNKIIILFDRNVTEIPSIDWFKTEYCGHFMERYKELFEYRKCLKSFVRTIYTIIMGNVKGMYKKFCLNDNEVQIAFDHLKCMDNETKPEVMEASDMLYKGVSYISTLQNVDEIFPATCCGLNRMLDIVRETLVRLCPGKSRPDTPEYTLSFIKAIMSDMFDMLCGKYPTTESCNEQHPAMMSDLNRELTNVSTVYDSFMLPLRDVLLKLDENVNIEGVEKKKN